MNRRSTLEECYKKYIKNITQWIPEGVISVDLNLLHKMNLLNYYNKNKYDPSLTRYFNVVESDEKITLVNDQFVVWIVPEKVDNIPFTYILIALNKENDVQLEMAFATYGVYNNSKLVLRILEKFLLEIEENESIIQKLESSNE